MHTRATTQTGFTLIELMVVVVIATILLGIAVPSYMSQIRESRRTEAKTAVMDLANREERFFSTNGSTYSSAAADMGYSALPVNTLSGYYTLSVCVPATAACDPAATLPPVPSYAITATAVGTQAKDTQCLTLGIDSVGQQFSTGSNTAQQCWGN